jgi:hypothetical protein
MAGRAITPSRRISVRQFGFVTLTRVDVVSILLHVSRAAIAMQGRNSSPNEGDSDLAR